MSYDIDIYFPQPILPAAEIESALSLLDLPVTAHAGLGWSIWIGSTVWVGVDGRDSVRTCAPAGTNWYANVGTSSGRDTRGMGRAVGNPLRRPAARRGGIRARLPERRT
jgi:hypothetical protein